MAVRWTSFDLKTGRRGPEVRVRQLGTASRIIGRATDTTLDVLCWDEGKQEAPPGWDAATLPGATMLVALNDADMPVWGGAVLTRQTSLLAVYSQVKVATLEAYFDRRYCRDQIFTDADLAAIVDGLVDNADEFGPDFDRDLPATGRLATRSYWDDEDKTVLSNLTELMDVEDGIEFTVDLVWSDDTHTVLRPVVRARLRLGSASTTPKITLNLPGNVTGGDFLEDYSSENGANAVKAVSSGEGDTRPESALMEARLPTWVRWERRITPSTSITDLATLDAHARAELAQTWDGLHELTLEAHLDATTDPATWSLGDDIGVSLTCPRFPARLDPDGAKMPGYSAVVRCIGWSINFDTERITPTLIDLQEVPA